MAKKTKNSVSPKTQQFVNCLKQMAGTKIVTLLTESNFSQPFDIDEKGNIGYDPSHKELFFALIERMINHPEMGGVVIIRQFSPLKTECINQQGEKVWIPIKNLYGLTLGQGQWQGVQKDTLRQQFGYDSQTGELLEKEPSVTYQAIPDYFFTS
jgi:hypothetical protein